MTIAEGRKPPSWKKMNEELGMQISPVGIEYAIIRVTNIGRTAVSVESIGLDVGRYRFLGRGRYTITPTEFRNPFAKDSDDVTIREPHRIEPGANVIVRHHIWPTLTGEGVRNHRGNRDLVVRGSATAVGRRPTLSSRRYAWKVAKDAVTRFSDHMPTREAYVYRVLWNESYDEYVGKTPLALWRSIFRRLEEGATVDDLIGYLDERNKDGIHHLVAYHAHRELHNARTEPLKSRRSTLKRILFGADPNC